MKVVHNNLSKHTDLEQARALEAKGEFEKAIPIYKKVLEVNRVNEEAYRRLMIIYRKQKDFKKELSVLRAGIKAFEELYQPKLNLRSNKKIAALSRALLKSTGLADKKGKPLYQKEPIGSWIRRKGIVESKIKKSQ